MKVQCHTCGAEIERVPAKVRDRNYCSRACQHEAFRNRVVFQCDNCQSSVERTPWHLRRSTTDKFYCSPECRQEARQRRVVVLCDTCGRNVELKSSRLRDRNYCSKECHSQGKSIAASRHLERSKNFRSQIESVVEEHLTQWQFDFVPQKRFRSPDGYPEGTFGISCDFYLPNLGLNGLVVECNGSYWHSDPLRYPDRRALDQHQLKNLARYERKVRLLEHLGIELIELWERDNASFKQQVIIPLLELETNQSIKRLDAAKDMEQVKWA